MKAISVARVAKRTVWRLLVSALFPFMITIAVINGVFALFGAHTIHLGGQPVTGIGGLIASPFIGAFIAGMFCVFGWFAITIGLWLLRFVRPSFRIDYDPLPAPPTTSDQAPVIPTTFDENANPSE
jgi:hypothetical protein